MDSLDHVRGRYPTIPLGPVDRIVLASRSYLETMLNFGLMYYLYYLFVPTSFNHPFRDIWEAVYFSGVTIATLGYGDLAPFDFWPQLFAIYEVLGGIILVVVAFSTYIGSSKHA